MKNPYASAPQHAFWSRAISRKASDEVDPVVAPSFRISPKTKVATAGSCFAQHIAKHLRKVGINPLVTERPHAEVVRFAEDFHYGVYTARYGNIYSGRQLVQLFERAYGAFVPEEQPWRGKGGEYIDPFRPLIPAGFATIREFERDRERHFAAIREMFETLDVMVFTLGLTETWASRADGAVFPSCPGSVAGVWDPDKYVFVNQSVTDVVADLTRFIARLRTVNPDAKVLLTVSPVPLVATATGGHVLPATVYSKSVLRVAAQQVVDVHENVDYFPSYEIITGPHAGAYFEDDRRNVRSAGVEAVMKVFGRQYVDAAGVVEDVAPLDQCPSSDTDLASREMDVICDELFHDYEEP
ncbi:GSCFA domain-containing protein [Caulobacter sp. LjRoot300]|uniref:GSCFA domain-containing protein n=1 Tax=Caulobacter sp. LjRoot300 TaxID=3342321 RepID=UPI003ED0B575